MLLMPLDWIALHEYIHDVMNMFCTYCLFTFYGRCIPELLQSWLLVLWQAILVEEAYIQYLVQQVALVDAGQQVDAEVLAGVG